MNDDNDIYVSVLVPNYNHAKYLDKRIKSILNQTYQNFEIIILDDCSTDNSLEIINNYKNNKKITKVIVNDKNSKSPFIQWSKGLSLCRGDWLWIAESDDFCDKRFLEILINAVQIHNSCVMAYCKSNVVNDSDKVMRHSSIKERSKLIDGISFVKQRLTMVDDVLNASAVIFKKESYLKITQDFTKYKYSGDRRFWTEIALTGDVYIDNHYFNNFRRSGHSVTDKGKFGWNNLLEDSETYNFLLNNDEIEIDFRDDKIIKSYIYSFFDFRSKVSKTDAYAVLKKWNIKNSFKPSSITSINLYMYGFWACVRNFKKCFINKDLWRLYNRIFHWKYYSER